MLHSYIQIVLPLCLVLSSYGKMFKPELKPGDIESNPVLCYPPVNKNGVHYIVGYGSLMKTGSKERTYKSTGANIPVEISGFRREWNLKDDSVRFGGTYLGVVASKHSKFNGAVFQVPTSKHGSEALESYDQREYYYCRKQVDMKDIKFLTPLNDSSSIQNNHFWIYVNKVKHIARPTEDNPIVQSYVDIFISGCLELEEKYELENFGKECVKTTVGWNALYWVNDRIYPRRPFVYEPKARAIDQVLYDVIPIEFKNIRLE